MYIVIAYDIEDDRLRNQVSRLLLDAGLLRVQKSVFEGEIAERPFKKLISKLKRKIAGTDSIRCYFQCGECRQKTIVMGKDLGPSCQNAIQIL